MREVCLKVDKIKCGGCIDIITDSLRELEGISNISGELLTQEIKFKIADEMKLPEVLNKLSEIGFPAKA